MNATCRDMNWRLYSSIQNGVNTTKNTLHIVIYRRWKYSAHKITQYKATKTT